MRRIVLTAGLAAMLGACSLVGIPQGCPAALLEGVLVSDGTGGLAVETDAGLTTVRWPDGYRVVGGGEPVLRDGWGSEVAREGQTIYVGGGMDAANTEFVACGHVSTDPPS